MEGLGALGFWLFVGMVVAASILSGGQKERDKEREKQETLRALLQAGDKVTPEVLQYLREKDAAEIRFAREMLGLNWFDGVAPRAFVAGLIAFVVGLISCFIGIGLGVRLINVTGVTWYFALPVMLGAWAVGLFIAAVIYRLVRGRKNVPPPGA